MDTESHETPVIPIRGQALKEPVEEPAKEPGRAAHAAYTLLQACVEALTRAWARRRKTWDKLKAWRVEEKPGVQEPPPRDDA